MKGGTDTGRDVCKARMETCQQRVKRRNCKQDDKSIGREQTEKERKTDKDRKILRTENRQRKRNVIFSFVYLYISFL